MLEFDGRMWETLPDFGTFKPIGVVKDNLHHYAGLSKDISKLPTYGATGSTARCVDTGEIYRFEESTKKWYKNKGGSSSGGTGTGGSGETTLNTDNVTVEGNSLVLTL